MSIRNTSHRERVAMVERHLMGKRLDNLAQEMQLNYYTVRKWWRKYQQQGWVGLEPRPPGPAPKGPLSRYDPLVKYVALRLKRAHPAWGLDVVLLAMKRRNSLKGKPLPKRSALGNYLHQFAGRLRASRPLRTQRPELAKVTPVQAPHQTWQMDFKGEEKVSEIGWVKPFIVCDKFSSAPLAGIIHSVRQPHQRQIRLTFRDVQQDLRQVFSQWGLPDQIQMDRDPLWVGSPRLEWPGTILLWLVGLDIVPIINRPHQPTDNAQVERCNRTWHELVCLGAKVQEPAQLQQLTDQAWQDRREHLPSRNPHCRGLPPVVAQPLLVQPRRPFAPHQEVTLFDINRVYLYLAQWTWERKVDTGGCISMANLNRRISQTHIGQIVKVRFDPTPQHFVARAVDGTQLRHFTLPVISTDYILGLDPGGT